MIWSPFSNLWLYRDTTDVVAARDEGLRICLGADWSPSGSKNLLGELKVADLWNRTPARGEFSPRRAVRDGDLQPRRRARLGGAARAAARTGLHGDVLVTTDRGGDPYRNLIERGRARRAVRRHQRLSVLRHLQADARRRAPSTPSRSRSAGCRRRIVLIYPGIKDADMGWSEVLADIAEAKARPGRALPRDRGAPPGRQAAAVAADRQAVGRPRGHRRTRARHRADPAARPAHPQRAPTSTRSRAARCTASCSTGCATTTAEAGVRAAVGRLERFLSAA